MRKSLWTRGGKEQQSRDTHQSVYVGVPLCYRKIHSEKIAVRPLAVDVQMYNVISKLSILLYASPTYFIPLTAGRNSV